MAASSKTRGSAGSTLDDVLLYPCTGDLQLIALLADALGPLRAGDNHHDDEEGTAR